jgi:hypothetical protein
MSGLGFSFVEVSRSQAIRRMQLDDERQKSLKQRPLLHKTQQTTEKNIHSPCHLPPINISQLVHLKDAINMAKR